MCVEDADDLRELNGHQYSSWANGGMRDSHRFVGLVGLAQRCRGAVHFLDNAGQVLAHCIQAIGQFLG